VNTNAKGARAKRRARNPFETTEHAGVIPLREGDEYGFEPGETLGDRCARLDEELAAARASIGARGEPVEEPEERSVLEEHLLALAVDAFEVVDGLVNSAGARVPYVLAREVTQLTAKEKAELFEKVQKAAGRHERFVNEHKDELALVAGLAAVQAKKLEGLTLALAGERALSLEELLVLGAVLTAPLLLVVGLILISQWRAR